MVSQRMGVMRVPRSVRCKAFSCTDINQEYHVVPGREVSADDIRILMISEPPPEDPEDYLHAKGMPLHLETTIAAFRDAGIEVGSMADILEAGVYITTALKGGRR